MKLTNEPVYRCEYCNRPYLSKSGCRKHEFYCYKNKRRTLCINCADCTIEGERCPNYYNYETKTIKVRDQEDLIVSCSGWKRGKI